MNDTLRKEFYKELEIAKDNIQSKEYKKAFYHLERSHILGQNYVIPHTLSHYWMLIVGIKTKDYKEIIGQLIRLPLGILGSAVGIVPIGNTGGANISAFKKLPIPDELKRVMQN